MTLMRRALRLLRRFSVVLAAAGVACVAAPAAGNSPGAIPGGVMVAGVPVGGLGYLPARQAVLRALERPLEFRLGDRRWQMPADRFASPARPDGAIAAALGADTAERIAVRVPVSQYLVTTYVESLAAELDRPVRNARLAGLVEGRPRIVPARPGKRVDRERLAATIDRMLRTNVRMPIHVPLRTIAPKVRVRDIGPIVVIRRDAKRLELYDGPELVRTFTVATGRASNPTPLGEYTIVDMQRHPWWYPPPSDWARGLDPVPPGPGNPLGTRWMGLDRDMIGVHGTPDAASIGYSASRGCVRMFVPDAEWLFEQVRSGTPVFIVSV
jgi:lipoprotein-anchoring transpeptidase ErfK/SrfK